MKARWAACRLITEQMWLVLIRATYQYSGLSLSCWFPLFLSSGVQLRTPNTKDQSTKPFDKPPTNAYYFCILLIQETRYWCLSNYCWWWHYCVIKAIITEPLICFLSVFLPHSAGSEPPWSWTNCETRRVSLTRGAFHARHQVLGGKTVEVRLSHSHQFGRQARRDQLIAKNSFKLFCIGDNILVKQLYSIEDAPLNKSNHNM